MQLLTKRIGGANNDDVRLDMTIQPIDLHKYFNFWKWLLVVPYWIWPQHPAWKNKVIFKQYRQYKGKFWGIK